jgi:hypothetical protein
MGPTHQRPTSSILSGHARLWLACSGRYRPATAAGRCAGPPSSPRHVTPALSCGASLPHRSSTPIDQSGGCAQASCYSARAPCPSHPSSSLQSRFSSSALNSVVDTAPSKSAAPGEPRPPFFLAWTLTKVVHLMDLFSFYPGGSETRISRRRPPSPPSSPTAASAGASPPLLRPLRAEEKCHGVQ